MYVVRKQRYLTQDQDEALKRCAAAAGVSEAEVVRRAVGMALRGGPRHSWRPGKREAMAELLETWAAPDSVLAETFDRESLYEARLGSVNSVVLEALRGVQDHHLSFFDAQMWAVARLNEIPALLTQDMATGSTVAGVMIVDPFETPVPGSTPGQDQDTAG